MRRREDILSAAALRPDYIGFIFVKGRKRYIDPETAGTYASLLPDSTRAVGVFIDEEPLLIEEIASRGFLDVIQLHGSEDADFIRDIRKRTGLQVIKAFRIETAADLAAAESSPADLVLLDSGNGGTGISLNHSLLTDMRRPYILAGGLTPENVAAAVRKLHPFAVDVSSGVETDGMKDPDKMAAFVRNARAAR